MAGPKVRSHVAIQNTKFTSARSHRRDEVRTLARAVALKLDRVATPYRVRGEEPPNEILERAFQEAINVDRMAPITPVELNKIIGYLPSRLAKIKHRNDDPEIAA